MRITGGIIGGRQIKVMGKAVRPTQDKVRAAIFSSLGDYVVGARVLDLFAGTGALGLEAWSRGAASVCGVESDRKVCETLRATVAALCIAGGAIQVVHQDVYRLLDRSWPDLPYNLILADPPYDRNAEHDRLDRLLDLLTNRCGWVQSGGVLVYEQSVAEDLPQAVDWELLRDKRYGDTRVLIMRKK